MDTPSRGLTALETRLSAAVAAGFTASKCAAILNGEGLKSPRGKPWNLFSVCRAVKAWGIDREACKRRAREELLPLIEALKAEGKSLAQIADKLNEEGKTTYHGGRIYPATIQRMLNREP